MTHSRYEIFSGFLKSADFRYSLDSEDFAEVFVGALFTEVTKRYGEEKARKMFAPYGRPLNNKDKTRWKNTGLILQLYYMKKPSILGLARELAGYGKDNADLIEARRQQIHRALNNKHVIAEAREVLGEAGDEGFDDFLRSIGH
jgi:hypothetical protein